MDGVLLTTLVSILAAVVDSGGATSIQSYFKWAITERWVCKPLVPLPDDLSSSDDELDELPPTDDALSPDSMGWDNVSFLSYRRLLSASHSGSYQGVECARSTSLRCSSR